MGSQLNPYVNFDDNARSALEFYQSVLGGSLTVNTFGEFGQPDSPDASKIMHGQLTTDRGYTVMAADTPTGMSRTVGDNVTLSISGDDVDDMRLYFQQLSAGGTVTVPLEKQMWGDEFGMLTDKFGVNWMVNITQN